MIDKFNRLALLVSAAAIAGGLSGPASAIPREDLNAVRELVDARDVAGLRAYIALNPQVLDGSVLGQELQAFMESPPRTNIFTSLGFTNPMPDSMRTALDAAKSDPSVY